MKTLNLNSQYRPIALAIVLAIIAGAAVSLASTYSSVPITGYVAGVVYVNVSCTTSIALVNSSVYFGPMLGGATNDTTDDFPPPFTVRNDGNVPVNISIRATSLFSASNPNPSSFFTFKCGNNTFEFNCTGIGGATVNTSQLTWARIPLNSTTAALAVWNLTFEDTRDEVQLDINVSIPSNESAGNKESSVSIEAASDQVAPACV